MAVIFVRTLILYFSLLMFLRLLGKRQLGEMELSEFLVASLIADLAANPLQDIGMPILNGLIPIVTLFCCELLISSLSMRSIRLRSFLFGKPSMLISHGKIDQKEMSKNRFTLDELMQEMRSQGVRDLAEVEYAFLETNGKLSILLYTSKQPPSAEKMNIPILGIVVAPRPGGLFIYYILIDRIGGLGLLQIAFLVDPGDQIVLVRFIKGRGIGAAVSGDQAVALRHVLLEVSYDQIPYSHT